MTPIPSAAIRKPAKSHAAFALHRRARHGSPLALVALVVGPVRSAAHAQHDRRPGMCSGMMTGTIGLAVPQTDGNFLTIPSPQITTGVFGSAECDCAAATGNPDINLEIKLTTRASRQHRRHRRDLGRRLELHQRHDAHLDAATRPARRSRRRRSRTSPSTAPRTSSSGLHYSLKANALSNPNPPDPTAHLRSDDRAARCHGVEQRLRVPLHRSQHARSPPARSRSPSASGPDTPSPTSAPRAATARSR